MNDGVARAPFLRRLRDLEGYHIGATDGDVGSVEDVYFDDEIWTVRYYRPARRPPPIERRRRCSPASARPPTRTSAVCMPCG